MAEDNVRQIAMRQRDRENGIVYLQVRISEETRDILRDHAARKKMKLAEYVRDRLNALAEQIVRRAQAQHTLPGCEKPTPTSSAPAATKPAQSKASTPDAKTKLQALRDALNPRPKSVS